MAGSKNLTAWDSAGQSLERDVQQRRVKDVKTQLNKPTQTGYRMTSFMDGYLGEGGGGRSTALEEN